MKIKPVAPIKAPPALCTPCKGENLFYPIFQESGGGPPTPPPPLPPANILFAWSGTNLQVYWNDASFPIPPADTVEVEIGDSTFANIVAAGNAALAGGFWSYEAPPTVPAGTYYTRVRYGSGGNFSPWSVGATTAQVPAGPVFDEDYDSIILKATTAGYTVPSPAVQAKGNQLVIDLKAAGIWDLLDLFYVFKTDGDFNFALINWKNPYNTTFAQMTSEGAGSLTLLANNGIQGDGAARLNTNYNVADSAIKYTQDDASFGAAFSDVQDPGSAYELMGTDNGITPPYQNFTASDGSLMYLTINDDGNGDWSNGIASTPAEDTGLHHIQRRDSLICKAFRNGVEIGSQSYVSMALVDGTFVILGATSSFTKATVGMAFVGASLAGKELQLYNAWQTYSS